MNDPFDLPSLEEIEEMDKQRSQAIESLQITDNSVRCQKCGVAVPILRTLTKPKSNRIVVLEKQIKWIEGHYHHSGRRRHQGNNNKRSSTDNNSNNDGMKQLKQELADLLKEDAKADKLRSLSLYSCRITGFKFVCSKCYDKVYMYNSICIIHILLSNNI